MDEEQVMSNEVMAVEDMLQELYDILDHGWKLPFSGGRTVVDGQEIHRLLDEIRDSLPSELSEAQDIVEDRAKIIGTARREADAIVHNAEEKAKALVNQDAVVRQAQMKAQEINAQTQTRVREMKKASNDYVDDLMRRTEEAINDSLTELRKTRQNIKAGQK